MLDPFSAVPQVPNRTRCQSVSSGAGVRLIQTRAPAGAVARILARRLGWAPERVFELDALGARFYAHIDGQRTLREIECALCRELGLDRDAARAAITEFVRVLMSRGLLVLRVEPKSEAAHV